MDPFPLGRAEVEFGRLVTNGPFDFGLAVKPFDLSPLVDAVARVVFEGSILGLSVTLVTELSERRPGLFFDLGATPVAAVSVFIRLRVRCLKSSTAVLFLSLSVLRNSGVPLSVLFTTLGPLDFKRSRESGFPRPAR